MRSQDLSRPEDLLATYPRTRLALSPSHRRIYESEYRLNREGRTFFSYLSQQAEQWMHRQVARSDKSGSVLELGAGTLNHLRYEPLDNIARYDIVEPFEAQYRNRPERTSITQIYPDISHIPQGERYDRIISVAVLEHLTELPFVVASSALLLREGGLFQHGIPSEGGLAWGLGWRLTTGLGFRLRTGLSYQALLRHEHVSTAVDIIAVIRYFFGQVTVRRFPVGFHHLSLYAFITGILPDRERCRMYLGTYKNVSRPLTVGAG